jgi:hypothetical protein
LNLTQEMLSGAEFEKQARPAAEAKAFLKRIKRSVAIVREQVSAPATIPGAWYAQHLLRNQVDDERLGTIDVPGRDPITGLIGVLSSCDAACDRGLNELANPVYTVEEGESWRRWVRRLSVVLDYGRQSGEAKRKGTVAALVSTVKAIQKRIPAAFRRHVQSDESLAKAVRRALSE